jgi:hypothetical protein
MEVSGFTGLWKGVPRTNQMGSWVGRRAGLDAMGAGGVESLATAGNRTQIPGPSG